MAQAFAMRPTIAQRWNRQGRALIRQGDEEFHRGRFMSADQGVIAGPDTRVPRWNYSPQKCWRHTPGAEKQSPRITPTKVPSWNNASTLRGGQGWHSFDISVSRWNNSPQASAYAAYQHWISETHSSADDCSTMEPRQHGAYRAGRQPVATEFHSGTSLIDSTTRCEEREFHGGTVGWRRAELLFVADFHSGTTAKTTHAG